MKKLSVCMGYFDSVHIGHRKLIRLCSEYADSHDMTSAVYTFGEDRTGLFDSLYSFDQRKILLENAGAALIISDIFSEKIMKMSGNEFLDELTFKYNIGAFFCGYDYTFGCNASCNAEFLLGYAARKHIYCFVMPPVKVDGQKASTTMIKKLLLLGETERANNLLGTQFFMTGRVIHGRGVGGSFGYPTANLDYNGFLPKAGVYKTLVEVDGREYIAVTNIGGKPTFNVNSITVESRLIGFDGDLYDEEITVKFIKYLRPIYKFSSGEELKSQINKDIREALC